MILAKTNEHNLAVGDQKRRLSNVIPGIRHCLVTLNHGADEKNMRRVAHVAGEAAPLFVAIFIR